VGVTNALWRRVLLVEDVDVEEVFKILDDFIAVKRRVLRVKVPRRLLVANA
jgi:hypothetical protein